MSEAASTEHRTWLAEMLSEAAAGLPATIVGEPVYGWRDRSVSAATSSREGEQGDRLPVDDDADLRQRVLGLGVRPDPGRCTDRCAGTRKLRPAIRRQW